MNNNKVLKKIDSEIKKVWSLDLRIDYRIKVIY